MNIHERVKLPLQSLSILGMRIPIGHHTVARFITGKGNIVNSPIFLKTEPLVSHKINVAFKCHREGFTVLSQLIEKVVEQIHPVNDVLNRDPYERGQGR